MSFRGGLSVLCLTVGVVGVAASAVGEEQPRVAALIRAIACSSDQQERLDAMDALRCLPPEEADFAAPALEPLFEVLDVRSDIGAAAERALFSVCRDPAAIGPRTAAVLLGCYRNGWGPDTLRRIPAGRRGPLVAAALETLDAGPVRFGAAAKAVETGVSGAELVPMLAEGAQDPDASTRAGCLFALARLGPSAAGALPAVRAAAARSPSAAGLAILRITGRLDEAAEPLLRHELPGDVFAWALRSLGPHDAPTLIRLLSSPARHARLFAAEGLASLGPAAGPEAAAALLRQTASLDASVRLDCIRALGRLGRAARTVVPDLERLASEDDDREVRRRACFALGEVGGTAARAALRRLLRTVRRDDRQSDWVFVAGALGEMGPDPRDRDRGDDVSDAEIVAERLSALLRAGPDWKAAELAVRGLVGLEHAALLPAWRMTRDPHAEVRRTGFRVLSGLAADGIDDGAVRTVERGLWDDDRNVRRMVAEGLGRGPAVSPAAVRRLGRLIADDSDFADALARLGPAAAPALPEMEKVLDGPDTRAEWFPGRIAHVIAAIGPPAARLADRMLRTVELRYADDIVRALRAVGPFSEAERRRLRAMVAAVYLAAPSVREPSARAPANDLAAAAMLLALEPEERVAEECRRVLREALNEGSGDAAYLLLALGPAAAFAADIWPGLLRPAPEGNLNPYAIPRFLLQMGSAARVAMPELRAAITAAETPTSEAVVLLWRLTGDPAECGPAAAAAVARMRTVDVGDRSDQDLLNAAAETGRPEAVAAVAALLRSPERETRRTAAEALLRCPGSSAGAAVALPALLECLDDSDVRVRRAALSAAMRIAGGP
jgi:HEAT repeat protein